MNNKICYEIPASQALLDLLRCTRKFRLRLRYAQDDTRVAMHNAKFIMQN